MGVLLILLIHDDRKRPLQQAAHNNRRNLLDGENRFDRLPFDKRLCDTADNEREQNPGGGVV